MQLTLKKVEDGELKSTVFHPIFVSARHYRRLLEFEKEIDYNDMSLEDTDKLVDFVCDVYNNQFTSDDFYKGVQSHELIPTIGEVFYFVRTGKEPDRTEKGTDKGKS